MISQDDGDRKSRFSTTDSTRERAASQPPRSAGHSSSPHYGFRDGPAYDLNTNPTSNLPIRTWNQQPRFPPSIARSVANPATRSASFSAMSEHGTSFASSVRADRSFPSTFEDDEDEFISSEDFDFASGPRYTHAPLPAHNGASELTRSRSQSLAAPGRAGLTLNTSIFPIQGPTSSVVPHTWGDSARTIPSQSRFGDIRPPVRYNTLATPSHAIPISRSFQPDVSNMSPFVRDVSQIVLDDQSALRDLWRTAGPQLREETGGGGSGTTSRRHSVSVVQPRRGVVGFAAPGNDNSDDLLSGLSHHSAFGSRSLMISDDELASDLGMLNLKDGPTSPSHHGPPSQPASLPNFGRGGTIPSPVDQTSRYIPMNLPASRTAFAGSQAHSLSSSSFTETKSDKAPSTSPLSSSPSRNDHESQRYSDMTARNPQPIGFRRGADPSPAELHEHPGYHHGAARYNPQTQEYFSHNGAASSPSYMHPPRQLPVHSQGGPPSTGFNENFHPQSPSDSSELGKGVPLHSVPASCPLYIVEFKAGRTDLFFCGDRGLDIRCGDLVIVEADRGKDLGKVVNDSITLAEVEAFQRQAAKTGFHDDPPLSPGGAGPPSQKRDINPKRIYGKAQTHDTQLLIAKMQDEAKALQLCQSKVKQKKLPMEVVDAEYQWDRRKLTFYFVSEKRIDFRELVRELFRLYKTRIWMASLQGPSQE